MQRFAASCFRCPLWSTLGYRQSKGDGKPAAHVHYCRKVNSKLWEVTDCFIAFFFFFFRILEFGQYNWLTEELIRGHAGHETGNCHPPKGTSLSLYSLVWPGNTGCKRNDEERLILLFADLLLLPLPLVSDFLPGEGPYYFPFSVQCLYFLSPTICWQ